MVLYMYFTAWKEVEKNLSYGKQPTKLDIFYEHYFEPCQGIQKELTQAFDESRVIQSSLACEERQTEETQEVFKNAEEELS